MYNSATGETLNKRIVQNDGQTLFDDYEPYKFDKFCYSVEWVGFSTPETFSMEYDHDRDQFTLNAQDAFSVLRYAKYQNLGDAVVVPMSDILFNLVGSLGAYRKIYITDTCRFQGETVNAILNTCEQQRNNFDEDNKPNDQLTVLSQLLSYIGLTAIPWHDALILTTPNAIREGWCNYNVWALPESGYIMTFGGGSYTQQPDEYISSHHTITEESHSGGTQISTVNIYNSATIKCDEYGVDMLLPDIGDNDNLSAIVASLMEADLLILLSDVEGLFTDDPRKNPNAGFIEYVEKLDASMMGMGKESSGSSYGTGGMSTKLQAAWTATKSGCDMVIVNASDMKVIHDIVQGENRGTVFCADPDPDFDLVEYIEENV